MPKLKTLLASVLNTEINTKAAQFSPWAALIDGIGCSSLT